MTIKKENIALTMRLAFNQSSTSIVINCMLREVKDLDPQQIQGGSIMTQSEIEPLQYIIQEGVSEVLYPDALNPLLADDHVAITELTPDGELGMACALTLSRDAHKILASQACAGGVGQTCIWEQMRGALNNYMAGQNSMWQETGAQIAVTKLKGPNY